MCFFFSDTIGTDPGLLCLRRFTSLEISKNTQHISKFMKICLKLSSNLSQKKNHKALFFVVKLGI